MVSPRENVEWNYVKGNILLCPWRLPFRLYPLSILSLSRANPRPTNEQAKGYKRTDPCVSPLFPLIFSPSLSLSQCPLSSSFHPASLSPLFFCAQKERKRENPSFLGGREEKTLLFSSSSREKEREREKRKRLERRNRARNTSSSWHVESKERFRGLNPGCNKVHQARYLATVIGLRCHESYVIILCGTWEAAVRGFPDWREKERERDQLVKAFFPLVPLRLRGESLICMIDGTRLHDRTHPIVLQSLNWMFNVVDFLWGRRTECCR